MFSYYHPYPPFYAFHAYCLLVTSQLFPFIETVQLHETFCEGSVIAGAAAVAGHVQDSGGEVEIQEGDIAFGCFTNIRATSPLSSLSWGPLKIAGRLNSSPVSSQLGTINI